MGSIPILQIRQTPGQIMIDADPGAYSIRQPKAEMQITSRPADMEIRQYKPELRIDQSKALAAYYGGSVSEVNNRIYSGLEQVFLQGLSKRMEMGERMREFFKPGNDLGNIMKARANDKPQFIEFRGPASMDNVDIRIETRAPDIEIQRNPVDIQVQINKPEIEYQRGKLDIYMKQYPSVEYIPPDLDLKM